MNRTLDLGQYRSAGSRVFAGRDRGEYVRRAEKLDLLDSDSNEVIDVKVPLDTFSVNSSFFLGLFGDTIRQLGANEFRRRFNFVGRPISLIYEAGIREALTTASPLSLDTAGRAVQVA